MLFGQRHEIRRFHRTKVGIVPADQRLDLPQPAVAYADLGLVHQMQTLEIEGSLQSANDLELGLRAHWTRVILSLARSSSSCSRRTGFSTGPAMMSPSASPSRNADSSTRRSKPLTIRT